MNCYRVHFTRDGGESCGYEYVPTLKQANAERKKDPQAVSYECITIDLTKTGVISALNLYASHPDNG